MTRQSLHHYSGLYRIFSPPLVVFLASMTQVLKQMAARAFISPDVPIDSLRTDVGDLMSLEGA